MRLTVVGGGGFRIPQIYAALADRQAPVHVSEVCLYDTSQQRLNVIAAVCHQLTPTLSEPPRLTTSTNLHEALSGADVVFSAMRISGTHGRVRDEQVALDHGLLGQETIGAGGLAYALRTLPHARHLAHQVAALAPDAWVINFTNPAGIITQAMREVLGPQVVGICDTPIGLMRKASRAIGVVPESFDYVGLNHLGWLRSLVVDGRDVLPELLDDEEGLAGIEEGRLFGPAWLQALGALPNEYLFYYYLHREAYERIKDGGPTRGQFLATQQDDFYARAGAEPSEALQLWQRARHDREASYMGESRPQSQRFARQAEDMVGGYEAVALDLMAGLHGEKVDTMILGVGNNDAAGGQLVEQLHATAVVEVPCDVDEAGVHPRRVAPVDGEMAGLMTVVKACEELVLRASDKGSYDLAWRAFAAHPLIDSVHVARELLNDYCATEPALGDMLR